MAADIKHSIGSRIRAARLRSGLTQEALATRIERTPESISNIERGQQLPSLDTLSDLGRVLAVPMAEFFDDAAEADRPRKRLDLEARWREIGRALTDSDLAIAIAQSSILLAKPV